MSNWGETLIYRGLKQPKLVEFSESDTRALSVGKPQVLVKAFTVGSSGETTRFNYHPRYTRSLLEQRGGVAELLIFWPNL